MESSRKCKICNVDVHSASYAKHLRREKHSENEKQNEMNIPEGFFKEKQVPIKNKS